MAERRPSPKGPGGARKPRVREVEDLPAISAARAHKAPPKRQPNRRSAQKIALRGRPVPTPPRMVPLRWIKFWIGLFLLPIAWILTETFFGAFSRATMKHGFWATEEFWFFGLGSILWALWFSGSIWTFGEPRPLRVYVFGHELTHAVWVWMMGGRVTEFEVSRNGGSILTDTDNVWVALSPYFYPIYSLGVVIIYGCASVFYDVAGARETFLGMNPLQWLFLLLGMTWSFHLSFTCWMIPKGQSDLTSQGTFFSLVFIYLMNVLVLAGFLIIAAPEIRFVAFGRELLENTENMAAAIVSLVEGLRPGAKSF